VIPFVDDYDPQNWYNSTTKQFKPNIAGYYEISLNGWWAQAGITNGQSNIQARKNGSDTFLISQAQLQVGSGYSIGGTKTVFLNGSTDYVDFSAFTSNTPSQTLQIGTASGSGTWFTAFLITGNTPPTAYVSSFNGSTGAVTGVSSVNGSTGAITAVSSFNGLTGAVTGVTTGSANTFGPLQSFTNGISAAGSTFSGLVTSASGFSGPVFGNATTATTATNISLTNTNANATFYPVLAGACGSTLAFVDAVTSPFTYNPSTRVLTAGNFTASAGANTTTFTQDAIVENNLLGFSISSGAGVNIDCGGSSVLIGDVSGLNNSTTLSVNDGTLTVDVSGGLYVSGAANIISGLGVTGNSRINGNLTVTSGICAAGISAGSYILTSSGVRTLTGTTYTFLSTDNGDVLTMNNASPITVTVPSGLPVGYSVTVIQLGAGQVSFTASGTTINSYQSYTKIAGQHGSASLISYSSNVFNLAGSLSA
jgi:hypothetical protein